MTNQEAIDNLKSIRQKFLNGYGEYTEVEITIDGFDMQALDMAIKALEQEPKLRQALEQEKGAYNALVKNIQCEGHWIPISERLPEIRYDKCGNLISNEVIIWCEKDSEGGEYEWYDIGFFRPTVECFEIISKQGYFQTICHISEVKAWMPLPKPYKAESKDNCNTCTHHKPDNPYCECCFDLDKYEKENIK